MEFAAVVRHGSRDIPAVALTFDDGPGAVTAAVLDVLAPHGARATFDVLGPRARSGARLLRRAVADGHEIGVHGWRHVDCSRRPLRRRSPASSPTSPRAASRRRP